MSDTHPCRHFRNKQMYVPGMESTALENNPCGLTHCWCNRTQREIGEDDNVVNLRECSLTQRACFEAR